MTPFECAIAFSLPSEGGLSRQASDHGGLTKYGIAQASHPNLDIQNLTRDQAIEIYRKEYWIPSGSESLELKLAVSHFDWVINHGIKQAVEMLQQIVGASPDGVIGSDTINKIASFAGPLVWIYNQGRKDWYQKRVLEDPSQEVFLKGWLNRVTNLENYLKTI